MDGKIGWVFVWVTVFLHTTSLDGEGLRMSNLAQMWRLVRDDVHTYISVKKILFVAKLAKNWQK